MHGGYSNEAVQMFLDDENIKLKLPAIVPEFTPQ